MYLLYCRGVSLRTLEMKTCGIHPPRSPHHEAVDSLISGNGRVTGDVPGGSGGAARIAAANAPQVVDGGGQQGPAVTAAATAAAAAE